MFPPPRQTEQFLAQAGFTTRTSHAPLRNVSTPSDVQKKQIHDTSKPILSRAFVLPEKEQFTVQKSAHAVGDIPKSNKIRSAELGSRDALAGRSSDNDIDIEDRPLGASHSALHLQSEVR